MATKTAGISDEAVKKRTGKTWAQWCAALDRAGCADLDHKGIVAVVAKRAPEIGGWWTQMVTVGYEQARGLRKKHEQPAGYQVGASRTIAAPPADVFAAFRQARRRRRWLDLPARRREDDVTVRKATPDRTLRITWVDGVTHLDVYVTDKGDGRSAVQVQHSKLKDAKAAEKWKAYWRQQLGQLKAWVES